MESARRTTEGNFPPFASDHADVAGAAGESIRFMVGECSLGAILVAATERGVCAILLGDEPTALIQQLADRFPEAQVMRDDEALGQLSGEVVDLVEAPGQAVDLPLDPRGTAFQQRVWQALREIPPGSTANYSEIALRIGSPHEAYAVGEACAANMIAVAIPCHRVVRKDGALAGYRWGFKRKRALLKRERMS
jgi:AraC family transcriptional regulator, regulatory protein of adaptative response / methylated-DNA-[protein]-cysteine methyltransferase